MEVLHDFGRLPVAGYLESSQELARNAPRYDLAIAISRKTGLVQQAYDDGREILVEKVYANYQPTYSMSDRLASYMTSFIDHTVRLAAVSPGDYVLEIGSNDGQMLKLISNRGFHAIGFEPSSNLAEVALGQGFEVIKDYFGLESARRFIGFHPQVRLVITRHTLEHAFDPLDFLRGIETVLAEDGVAAIEVPYIRLQMINGNFESMTFQHVSFFSVTSLKAALKMAGLEMADVIFVNMDGGAMVVFARKARNASSGRIGNIESALLLERFYGLGQPEGYETCFRRMEFMRLSVKPYLNLLAQKGRTILGYGAGGKGQALLNMLGLDNDEIHFVIDDVPGNAGKYIPGTGIEVIASSDSRAEHADAILLTAPTHALEIMRKEAWRLATGTCFLATVPDFHQVEVGNI